MKKLTDPVILGGISGVIGNAAMSIIGTLARRTGIARTTSQRLAARIVLPENESKSNQGRLVGSIADYTLGSALGVGIVYLLKATGKKYAPIKGAGIGALNWIVLYGGLSSIGITGSKRKVRASTALTSFFSHLTYGVTTALVASWLGSSKLLGTNVPDSALDKESKPDNHRIVVDSLISR